MKLKLLLMLFIPLLSFSQKIEISGKVSSNTETLPGVNILEKGSLNGVNTDFNGDYIISVEQGATLIVSSIGYKTQEVKINGRTTINIILEEDTNQLDEIVVRGFTDVKGRARKRLESIQSVPESITAVTSAEIEATGIEDIGGLLTQIPGITYGESQDPGTVIISVRGIPQIRYGPSPIATIVDGVYLASPDLNSQALFDIEQIEVIKGSQGLFYGKNAIGGAVIITTKQPKNGFEGRVKTGYGNGNTSTVQANIGGSITDNKSFYRLGINYLNSDGFINNTTLNKNVDFKTDLSLRGQLKFKLGTKSMLSFNGQYGNNKGGAVTFVNTTSNNDFPVMSPNIYKGSPNGDILGEGTVKSLVTSASFETNFNGSRLSSHTSYSDVDLFYNGDYNTYGPIYDAYQEMTRASRTFNQELRLVSTNSASKLKWNLGLFYQNINSDWDTNVFANKDITDLTYANVTKQILTNDDNKLSSIGLFGFIEYDITDKFNASVGIRNEWESLENFEGQTKTTIKRSYDAFQPKVSVSYKFIKDKMLYASWSKGFRSGGYNPDLPTSGIEREIKPEFSTSFETGIKTSFWNNRFLFNVAYFNTVFENQQIYRFGFTSDFSRSFLGTINYEESKISGFEIDTKLRLSKNIDLIGGYSVINSEITKAFEPTAVGNKVPFAPQSSYNLGINTNFKIGEKSKLLANINIENKGKKYWFADDLYGLDQEDIFQDPYNLINAKVILELNDHFSVGLWGRNIFNTQYNQEWWPLSAFGNGDIRTPSQPATFGMDLTYRF